MQPPDATTLAGKLSHTTFLDLFQRLDREALDSVWEGGDAAAALEKIVHDKTADWHARFLAAEILFVKLPSYPPPDATADLVEVYAAALRNAPASMANPWGLPGRPDGQIAEHVLRLGDGAVASLSALLDDARPVTYGGSQEAAFGNSYRFRVKDIAAALIARIRALPFAAGTRPKARDAAILELRRFLEAGNERRSGPSRNRRRGLV